MGITEKTAESIVGKYFSLVPDRQCGDCMVCCEYMPISTQGLIKPGQTLCPHVIVNRGCSIYDTRPNVCRTWHCLWRRDATMPDELRPDKSGVIFSLIVHDEERSLFEQAHITCIAMRARADHDAPRVAETIQRYVDEAILPVWIGFDGGKRLLHPEPALADAIVHPVSTVHAQRVEEGKRWRAQYEGLLESLLHRNGVLETQFVKR
jgi:Fe-S-cluster containining protein